MDEVSQRPPGVLYVYIAIGNVHGAYEFLIGELSGLGFVMSLTGNPLALIWPILFVIPLIQFVVSIVAFRKRLSRRSVWWCALCSICLSLAMQSAVIGAIVSSQLSKSVKIRGWAPLLAIVTGIILLYCLAQILRQRRRTFALAPADEPDDSTDMRSLHQHEDAARG